MGKEVKTNAMRILERSKIPYKLNRYECKEFIDGVHIADMLGQRYDMSFKTIVTIGHFQRNLGMSFLCLRAMGAL